MARKRHKPEEIIVKLRQAGVLTSQGAERRCDPPDRGDVLPRWRNKYGGLKSDQVKR